MYLDLRGKLPHAYLEMGRLCMKESALHFVNETTDVVIPAGRIAALFLGPGTTVTHNAIKQCSWAKCTMVWVGEDISKCYSVSSSVSRSSENFQRQVFLYEHKKGTLLKKYYKKRFGKAPLWGKMSEEKIRGIEGAYMKKIYLENAIKYGIPWSGRMKADGWDKQTLYNRAISICNSYLYGLCSAVLNALGYSTALGLLHRGNMLSFTFDLADLYKKDYSIPLGFEIAKQFRDVPEWEGLFEKELRRKALHKFFELNILVKILTDVEDLLGNTDLHNQEYSRSDEEGPISISI